MKNLSIISIDGVNGVGKSTQAAVLSNYFKDLGIPTIINRIKDDIGSGLKATGNTWQFLKDNPNGVVINDGSFAKMMQMEVQSGKDQKQIIDEYEGLTHEYECLNHKYGMANVLIFLDEIDICRKRLFRRRNIMGTEDTNEPVYNMNEERLLAEGLKRFDSYILAKSIKFHTLETHQDDSILEIHENILKVLNDNFEIKNP